MCNWLCHYILNIKCAIYATVSTEKNLHVCDKRRVEKSLHLSIVTFAPQKTALGSQLVARFSERVIKSASLRPGSVVWEPMTLVWQYVKQWKVSQYPINYCISAYSRSSLIIRICSRYGRIDHFLNLISNHIGSNTSSFLKLSKTVVCFSNHSRVIEASWFLFHGL